MTVTAALLSATLAGCTAGSAPGPAPSSTAAPGPNATGTASGGSAGTTPGSSTAAGPGRSGAGSSGSGSGSAGPAHVVVVVMENHGYDGVVGSPDAPWLNGLPAAVFTNWSAVTHPSQPNYLALFSGSTQGVTDDGCPLSFSAPDLGSQLLRAGLSFAAYSEGLPAVGDPVCSAGRYARKHAPWTDFPAVPGSVSLPFTAFPTDFDRLPRLAFVIPDLCHDTHNCSVATGDRWLAANLGPYATWAAGHDSLLVVTYDEDDDGSGNHIPTLVTGAGVRPGRYGVQGDHYTLLRTLESLFGLPPIGAAAGRTSVAPLWR